MAAQQPARKVSAGIQATEALIHPWSQFEGLFLYSLGRGARFLYVVWTHHKNLKTLLSVLGFVDLTQTRVTWEQGASMEELPPSDWPIGTGGGGGQFLD